MTLQHPPSPGWYDDARGGRRWWDGRQWSSGAPLTELREIAPPISAPSPAPMLDHRMVPDTTIPSTVVHHVVHPPSKELTAAYLLLLFLGTLGAHRFYLGRVGTAITMLSLTIFGSLASATVIGAIMGLPLLFAVAVWWLIDLFLTPGMVREGNRRAAMAASAPDYSRGWPQP